MRKIETEVLVIGGGATGTGVVRDLAMRGFKTVLVEKSDLTTGTSGRYHGLLHSGGRYAVKDPAAARECIEENTILRRIMPHCIEDTGGFFVVTPWDDPDYAPRFVAGCQTAGIPVEEVPVAEMLRQEALLNPRILQCFRVPDGSADSFLGSEVNALSARQHGASVLVYHEVKNLLIAEAAGDGQPGRVKGALVYDRVNDEDVYIVADLVVNASGAWAGKIASSAGVEVKIIPGKGTMLAVNHRIVNTVINRCKMPSDGDILVPAHTVAVIGTTDTPVPDPDRFAIEDWEVQLMLEEGEKLVPGFKDMRMLRAWAGVRPLYQETVSGGNRDVTRAFVLLDHETRDGIPGLVTITSGKWTTYRKMAEVTVDLVCEKLGVERKCRTHLEELSNPHAAGAKGGYHYLGLRLAQIEKEKEYGNLVCECELATVDDVRHAIVEGEARTVDDVRRKVRLGKGPCQGGFCTFRVVGMLHDLRGPAVEETNAALRDFLQERWKGLLPVLWGQQLRQERLDELIYMNVLNADHLPGPHATPLATELYEIPAAAQPDQPLEAVAPAISDETTGETGDNGTSLPEYTTPEAAAPQEPHHPKVGQNAASPMVDVVVVGAGLAGLTAALVSARQGRRTRLISKGMGATHWTSGCIDVLGYYPYDCAEPLESPVQGLARLVQDNPRHPYALAGLAALEEALAEFKVLCLQAGYPMHGSLERNWLLPTALGTGRPTCLAPETMIAGDLRKNTPMLIIGIESFGDFFPRLIAANLAAAGIPAQAAGIRLPLMAERRFVTARTLAWAFDNEDFRTQAAEAVRAQLSALPADHAPARVGMPAVLGWNNPGEAWRDLQERIGLPVFEIPTLPPSVPGIRLHNLLGAALAKAGGRFFDGMQAEAGEAEAGAAVSAVYTEAAARQKIHRARAFVLATGGILGGGVKTYPDGRAEEVIFGLPVQMPPSRAHWFQRTFLTPQGHPVYRAGVAVDESLRPLSASGETLYPNLFAAGSLLASYDPIQERSLEGAALVTGYRAGQLAGSAALDG